MTIGEDTPDVTRSVDIVGEGPLGVWNLIGYSSDEEIEVDDLVFTDNESQVCTFTEAWTQGKVAPYFAGFNPLAGDDGKFEYAASSQLGSSFENNFTERDGYWIKSYVDGVLNFTAAGGSSEAATYDWADVRVDNGTLETDLDGAATNGWTLNKFYYHDSETDQYKQIYDFGHKDLVSSWEGLFLYSYGNSSLIKNQ
jgi:hypothetical protein